MALHAMVETYLDERMAEQAADELVRQFTEAGEVAGKEFRTGLKDSMSGADLKGFTEGFARGIAPEMKRHGKASGREFGESFKQEVRRGIDDAIGGMTGQFGAFGRVAESALTGITSTAGLAALGIAGVGIATVVAGKQLYDLGAMWDNVADSITARTGKMGTDLEGIVSTVQQVGNTTAISLDQIGNIAGSVSQSLHLTGEPLKVMTDQLASLQQVTGETVDVRNLGKAFRIFDVEDVNDQVTALNHLLGVSQATGIPINDLVKTVREAGKSTKQFGLDLSQTAALITIFEDAGMDAEKSTSQLEQALGNLARAGTNPVSGLQQAIEKIKELHDAGQEAAAIDLARSTFGEGFAEFLSTIESGQLDVKNLHDALKSLGADDLINKQKEATEDWREEWQKLTNHLETGFAPVADWIFGTLNKITSNVGLQSLMDGASSVPPAAPGQGALTELWGVDPNAPKPPGAMPGIPLPGIFDPNDNFYKHWYPNTANQPRAGAPRIPYSADYGQPPQPGESDEHWRARMANIAAQHDVAEAEARVTQLQGDVNATADEVTQAQNAVTDARMRAWESERKLTETQQADLSATIPYAAGYGAAPRPGQSSQQYGAEQSLLEAQHKTAVAAAEYNSLMASGAASTAKLNEAHNKLLKAQNDEYMAQMRLSDAYDKTNGQLDQIGAKLDEDFGASKGLPELFENLTKALANLAFAPVLGALEAVKRSSGYDEKKDGSGLFGIFGAGNRQQSGYTPSYLAAPGALPGGSAGYGVVGGGQPYGLPAGTNTGGYGSSGGIFPPWVHALEQAFGIKASTYPGHQESDRNEPGYAPNPNHENRGIDWSGPVDAMQKFADYLATIPGALEQVIWQNPNTGQDTTIAGGRPVSGYYDAGTLAEHENHVHTRQSAGIPVPGGIPMPSGIATPPNGQWSADWLAMAQKESGGNWAIDSGNGFQGGLQFTPSSWQLAGGSRYAPSANLATPYQQALTAENLLTLQGPGAWPNTYTPGSTGPAPDLFGVPGMPGGALANGMPQAAPFGAGGPAVSPASFGSPFAGLGGPAAPSQSVIGGRQPGQGLPAASGIGFSGGIIGAAASMAASAAGGAGSFGAGGGAAGAAAQLGIQEIGRAIGAMGQYVGAGVGGLIETFGLNDSALGDPSKSWLGRIGIAAAGMRPALPNTAGMLGGEQNPNMLEAGKKPPEMTPEQAAQGGPGGKGGNVDQSQKTTNNNVTINNQNPTAKTTENDIQAALGSSQAAMQPR